MSPASGLSIGVKRDTPQYKATSDGHFSSYVADNNHLFRKHNISPEVNTIIQRIFVLEPNSRISISKLKNEIKSVKTFFREMQDTVNTVPFPVNDSAGPQIPSLPMFPLTPTVPAPAFLPTTRARAPSSISGASYSYPDAETASNRPIWISELTEPYSAPTASEVSVISQPFGGPSSSDDDPSIRHPSSQSENESSISSHSSSSPTDRSPTNTSSSSSEETSSSSRSSTSNSTPSSSSSPSTVLGIKSIEVLLSFDNDENNNNNNDIVTYDCRSRPRLSLNPRLIRRFRPNSVPFPSSPSSPSPSASSPSSPSFPTSNRHRFSTPTTFCSHYRKTDHDHMTIENGKETQGQGERCTATKGSRMSRMGRKFWNETKRVLSGMS
ncbi:hypothetical protein K435DRAFT_863308 [Dendrothele bispora CBS 962.96]|uniref:Protein kinase domain-containing protein n=1 Tax=Dendrothele bispora (strain CBS 962.96) TaxID=1314807 RepID=A0A4S8LQ67_DENBC|nr:hypothetical protein K435DRAFT_863308 [Dendrothele bispora CBS 962.96]